MRRDSMLKTFLYVYFIILFVGGVDVLLFGKSISEMSTYGIACLAWSIYGISYFIVRRSDKLFHLFVKRNLLLRVASGIVFFPSLIILCFFSFFWGRERVILFNFFMALFLLSVLVGWVAVQVMDEEKSASNEEMNKSGGKSGGNG
jgi:hypothetical protein